MTDWPEGPTWFLVHAEQRTDTYRGAQNQADNTGRKQRMLIKPALVKEPHTLEDVMVGGARWLLDGWVTPDPVRYRALGERTV